MKSTALRFLEAIGAEPLSKARYQEAVSALNICSLQRRALADRDVASLKDLLGGRSTMMCMIMVPDEA
jgi:hypothetical protein